jgi:hypothetical protein
MQIGLPTEIHISHDLYQNLMYSVHVNAHALEFILEFHCKKNDSDIRSVKYIKTVRIDEIFDALKRQHEALAQQNKDLQLDVEYLKSRDSEP